MACEYFVGGKWVTEAQFKEILNNGLLDNLVANGDISLKNYKTDNSKVIKRETKTITRDKIPANKLANILAKEIKSRAGYPLNMLAALELNSDGTDFKIPLWASPYATKFESLLTSLVSNKVVKQKLPGTSSVLGSEEGFKIKQGDEAAGDLKNSGIVFTESFDPTKGLQPMRWDPKTKKILPDQVIMPFKFRAESGEILNIDEFTVVVRDGEESRKMLDMTKVPKEILETFGFRIPTQKQNSMAAIEIVGFLPEGMGDLLLAPRDFTKRMGSDFDVDKLYQYFYNIFYQDGKLYNNFLSDPKAIEKAREATVAQIEELKDSLKFTKEERKLMDQYVRQNLERTEENEETEEVAQKASDLIKRSMSQADRKMLDDAFTRLSVLNRSYVASRQNNIVKTHLRIANSSNPEVIKMFLGTDSPGMFKDLSRQVDNTRTERGLVPPVITILSDTYQRTKYINATAGKDAVGGFSLDSTFNAVAQGKDLIILNINPENTVDVYGTLQNPKIPTKENILTYNMPLATFGNTESKGDLSNKYTLRSQAIINKAKQEKRDLTEEEKKSLKYKSYIIRTLQSSALDNETAQILDKININNQTFDAIRALALLGFEETDIAGLLSQEIIWEYVDALKDANSSLTPYNPNAEEDIVNDLISKYDPQNKFRGLNADIKAKYQSQSGEELMDNISTQNLKPLESGETPDYNLQQLAILEKFRTLSAHGKTIKQLQSTINTASKGLPKSLIEVNAKVEQISKLPFVEVFNGDKLLGEYVNNQLIKPEGINGYASYYGTLFADKVFNEYFPYKTQGFQTAVGEILTHTPKGLDVSINKKAEVQAEVFEDVRSYLYGNPNTNLFTGDPTLERKRLFIDSDSSTNKNKSLATVLNTLSNQPWFQKNGFLNKLSFDLNKNGQISRINFEAAAGENFDERNIYDGFVYLLTKNFPVGNFNGRDYTSRTLAQELIAAAFLEGGTQGAKQYLKYVPISYLKVLGFGDYLQKVPFDFMATFYGNLSEYGPIYNQPSSFTRQYFQNNPDKTKTVSLSDLKGTSNSTPKDYFTLNPEALLNNFVDVVDPATGDSTQMQTQFLSIYDTKEPSKYALFEFDSVDRNYKRIPVLAGSYGFVAYNSTPNVSIPVERGSINSTPKLNAVAPGYNLSNIPVQPTKGFDINVVNNTAEAELTAGMPISKSLNGTKEALDDLLNNLETAEGVSTLNKQLMMLFRDLQLPEKFKVEYVTKGKGSYDYDSSTLSLNLNHKDHTTADGLATTVLHELTHTFTGDAIKKYERGDTDLSPSQIAAIQSLEKLQKIYIDNLTEQGEAGSLAEFKAKYEAYAASDRSKSPNLSKAEISKYYGAIKLSEFVTMALTDVEFQKRLNDIKTESGKTVWEQIKEALFNLLNTLGLDIKPGSALATSVKDTFDLIEANQEALKADNITTESFMEHGTKYKFQVNGNGEVIKAEYSQGMSMVYNPMNTKNAQKKYDSLKQGIIEQPIQAPINNEITVGSTVYSNYGLYNGDFEVVKIGTATLTKRGGRVDRVYKRDTITLKPLQGDDTRSFKILGSLKDGEFFGTEDSTGSSYSSATTVQFKLKPVQPTSSVKPTIDLSKEWAGDLKTRPVYTAEGVNTMRTEAAKKDEHFGNPFSEAGYGDTRKVPSIQTAVQAYKDWLLTGYAQWLNENGEAEDFAGKQEQRQWILNQINEGKLDGATLLYAGKSAARGQGMHPTALAEVVEQLRSKPTQPTVEPTNLPGPDTKINIYAGTGENAELSNFAERPFIPGIHEIGRLLKLFDKFKTVEGAYQAAKLLYTDYYTNVGVTIGKNKEEQFELKKQRDIELEKRKQEKYTLLTRLANATGAEAKKIGRTIPMSQADIKEWDDNSSRIMKALIKESFEQNPDAFDKLLATGNATLTHTQDKGKWGTEFPKLLMEVRDELRSTQPTVEPVAEVKEGVSELFESNPELANAVYEALGFNPNEFSLVLKKEEENPEGIMLGEYDIIYKDAVIGNVFLPIGFKNYTIKGIGFKEQYLNKGLGKAFYKWLGNKADIENATLNSDFDNTSESAKRVWESLKKENLAVDTQMGYKFSPKNLKQQALQLYSQYLDTIFPDSEVKDIVYHLSNAQFEKFDKQFISQNTRDFDSWLGFFFTTDKNKFKELLKSRNLEWKQEYPAIVNIKKVVNEPDILSTKFSHVEGMGEKSQAYRDYKKSLIANNNDGIISPSISGANNITVFEPEQIHILGNKQDVAKFKKFVDLQQTAPIFKEGTVDAKYELFPGVYANKGQQEAIDLLTNFLDSDKTAFLLQGKGGTGKTTIIKKIVEEAKAKGLTVLGIAPTHKAKKVLGSSVKGIKTTTLAAALAIKLDETTGNFSPDEYARSKNRVPIKNADFIVIDESSMVSDKLLEEIKSMITKGTKVIFMGDRAQLPPVGQESDSKVFNIGNGYELTEKMRQAATSPIINIGSKIAANVETTGQRVANPIEQSDRKNQTDPISGSSITWESNETTALNDFVEDIKESKGDLNYAKIITFNNQNHNSPQSVKNLNIKVREKLFGKDKADKNQFVVGEILTAYDNFGGERPEFYNSEDLRVKSAETRKGIKFTAKVDSQAKGSRSIEITLDIVYLDLINDEGKVIKEVPVVAKESRDLYNQTLQKLFKTDPQLAYGLQGKFANLEYGYAVTSHKAQGSTYTNVYVMEDNIMGASNGGTVKAKNQSLYVAVSRPTTKLVMVSSKNSSGPLNLSALSNLESYREMPIDTERESNRPSQDDLEAYYRSLGEDQTLETSPINPKEVEKYLLICGK